MASPALTQRLLSHKHAPLFRELFSFCVVGGIGFLADLGLFIAAQYMLSDVPARCVGLVGATLMVWWLNRQFTFKSADPQWGRELGRFALTRIFGTALNAFVSLGILWEWPDAGRTVAVAAGTIVALTINYLTSKHWAYR